MRGIKGFTLIEILVTIGILAILLSAAAPSMRDMVLNNRVTSLTNDLLSDLAVARSEALKRGQRVVVCKNAGNDAACGNGQWNMGWLLFVDTDSDSTLDTGETILRVRQTLTSDMTVTSTGIVDTIVVRPVGLVTPVGSFKICDTRAGPYGRNITVAASGRASVSTTPATCP